MLPEKLTSSKDLVTELAKTSWHDATREFDGTITTTTSNDLGIGHGPISIKMYLHSVRNEPTPSKMRSFLWWLKGMHHTTLPRHPPSAARVSPIEKLRT